MDVFASTIRRLPTAIDWSQNSTLLPAESFSYQKSSFLCLDPTLRWKSLVESKNRSGKAWFILLNSLMRNIQVIVYSPSAPQANCTAEDREVELLALANAIFCAVSSLPEELAYHGEVLTFRALDAQDLDDMLLQRQSDKYSLHLMTQLSHFMVNHHQIRAMAPWFHESTDPLALQPAQIPGKANSTDWFNYMAAADEIVTVVRNSSVHHYRYVNPFLANTLWFAAAAQCSCRVFGPASLSRHRRLADSNLELLRLTIDRFIDFWGSTEMLKDKLARMESGLKSLMERRNGMDNAKSLSQQQPARSDTESAAMRLATTANMDAGMHMIPDDLSSTLATSMPLYESTFDNTFDGFPFGLDDLLMPHNSALLYVDL